MALSPLALAMLPEEVLLHVLRYLRGVDLARLACIARRFSVVEVKGVEPGAAAGVTEHDEGSQLQQALYQTRAVLSIFICLIGAVLHIKNLYEMAATDTANK
jgi:hypothetical protein